MFFCFLTNLVQSIKYWQHFQEKMKHFIHYSFNKTFNIGCINLDWGNSDIWSKEMLKKILNIHQGRVFWAHVYFNIVVLADAFALSTWFSKRKEKQDLNHNARLLKYVVLLNCSATYTLAVLWCWTDKVLQCCCCVWLLNSVYQCIWVYEVSYIHTDRATSRGPSGPKNSKNPKWMNVESKKMKKCRK